MNIPLQIVKDALTRIDLYKNFSWPEDEWKQLSPGFDMNIFEIGGIKMATIYPVVDGNTLTLSPLLTINIE